MHLASQSKLPKLQPHVAGAVSPAAQADRANRLRSGAAAAGGKAARIVLKMNALTDEALMLALVRAGQQGVRIDLIVRGACMLPAPVPGATDNIRVRSIIGRFLEHSRVFYFRHGRQEELYLSSADWMNRNMLRRIELAWPVTDASLRQRIVDECLVAYLHDDRDAWDLMPDGHYKRVKGACEPTRHGAQAALMRRYRARPGLKRIRDHGP